ncbi:MAG: hypothetical protein K8R54_01730 [Bacteroidales bacterium]|nr:hypothetical protein [Bacteroidales bacterium]
MNPFQNIDEKIGLQKNKNSPFFGRFRLSLGQVYPFREPAYERALIKIKDEFVEDAEIIHELFPEHIYLFHFYKQGDIRNNKYIQINCFKDDDYFFEINCLSDVKYLAMENFYFALLELSPFLEDFHFFIYSTGDDDDRWIDEYNNKNGQLTCNRILCDIEIYYGRIAYYIDRVDATPENRDFKIFAVWQIYDELNHLADRWNVLDEDVRYKNEVKFIDACNNDILLNNCFTDLKNIYRCLLSNTSKLANKKTMSDFINWCSINKV